MTGAVSTAGVLEEIADFLASGPTSDQFEYAERLMRLTKAGIHARKAARP